MFARCYLQAKYLAYFAGKELFGFSSICNIFIVYQDFVNKYEPGILVSRAANGIL